jgi:hypothetical protein
MLREQSCIGEAYISHSDNGNFHRIWAFGVAWDDLSRLTSIMSCHTRRGLKFELSFGLYNSMSINHCFRLRFAYSV